MTVKRLDSNQPKSFSFSKEDIALINNTIQNYPDGRKQSAVVPSLYIAQKRAGGWLPEQAILKVAEMLDMPKMRVLEIASFYSMFNCLFIWIHLIPCKELCYVFSYYNSVILSLSVVWFIIRNVCFGVFKT